MSFLIDTHVMRVFAAEKSGRFQVNDFTVLDTSTNLLWTRDADSVPVIHWYEAIETVSEMNRKSYGGLSTWRLPSKAEFETLVEYGKIQTNGELEGFKCDDGLSGKKPNYTGMYDILTKIGFTHVNKYRSYYTNSDFEYDTESVWVMSLTHYSCDIFHDLKKMSIFAKLAPEQERKHSWNRVIAVSGPR
jgi:hypothetical protein